MRNNQGKKLPDKFWNEFIEIYKNSYASVTKVCHTLGIATTTYYRHLIDDPDFKNEIDSINEFILVPIVENALVKKAVEGDGPSQRFFLMYRGGENWNPVLKADKFYQKYREKVVEEQYTPDDPLLKAFNELVYLPITKQSICDEYVKGKKDPQFVNRELKKLLNDISEYKRYIKQKKAQEKVRRNNSKK